MKLIIQIPCFNEEKLLPVTFKDLPRKIEGINKIEYLLINDGSTDKTLEVAKNLGFNHIVSIPKNKGLANAFMLGLDACLRLEADIIVNTDADNQYKGSDIRKLVRPILEGKSEVVIGQRPIDNIKDFSWLKKKMEKFGSWVVGLLSGLQVPDAPSGFRAFSRDAALRINVVSEYTYTLETIIQMSRKNISITSVPISTNEKQRDSRLVKNMFNYIIRSFVTIIRIFIMYKPLRFFATSAVVLFISSLALIIRFIYFYIIGLGNLYIKSLITGGVLITLSLLLFTVGLLSDIISSNRILIEETLYRARKIEYNSINKRNSNL